MRPIKISITDRDFLKKIRKYISDDYSLDWRSPTGCLFQDMYSYSKGDWIEMTPEAVHKAYKSNPNQRVKLCLIGNNLKFYSTCKIKNIYVEVWK